jgi:hypothetical protein
MTTKIHILNDPTSNGDVILDAVNTTDGRIKGFPIRPGESRELWITTNSAVILTETWPTQPKNPADGDIISECGDKGERWAKAFVRQFPNADEDTMRAWFANAIEGACAARARPRPLSN